MILVVEDDQITQRVVSKLLASTRFQIDITSDAYQAINYVKQNNYIIALVDLVLPGMLNGVKLISQIKKHSPATKIIACSSYGNLTHKKMSARAGADLFLLKPFNPEELLSAVNNLARINKKVSDLVVTKSGKSDDENSTNIPDIFNGFPEAIVQEIMNHGVLYKLAQNDKHVMNYTEYIGTVIRGSAICYYKNKKLGLLNEKESIGYEFITESFDPDSTVTIQAASPLQLIVIPGIDLIKFLHAQKNDLLQLFKVNSRTLRTKSIFNRSIIKNQLEESELKINKESPDNDISDIYDFDTTDLLGI
ncbi:response regulator [candidate division KSB1 bacterium]|nr:response regulator [candidate division KSB1 bacterium]